MLSTVLSTLLDHFTFGYTNTPPYANIIIMFLNVYSIQFQFKDAKRLALVWLRHKRICVSLVNDK